MSHIEFIDIGIVIIRFEEVCQSLPPPPLLHTRQHARGVEILLMEDTRYGAAKLDALSPRDSNIARSRYLPLAVPQDALPCVCIFARYLEDIYDIAVFLDCPQALILPHGRLVCQVHPPREHDTSCDCYCQPGFPERITDGIRPAILVGNFRPWLTLPCDLLGRVCRLELAVEPRSTHLLC